MVEAICILSFFVLAAWIALLVLAVDLTRLERTVSTLKQASDLRAAQETPDRGY